MSILKAEHTTATLVGCIKSSHRLEIFKSFDPYVSVPRHRVVYRADMDTQKPAATQRFTT
jgi:hypothetical protein